MTPDEDKEWREEMTAKLDQLVARAEQAWALLEEMMPKRSGLMGKMMKGKK